MLQNSPKVTVCIPTYNQRAEFLRVSIESALSQTYENLEVIVSDNHSTNDAPQVIAEFIGDPRLKVVKPPAHVDMEKHFAFAATFADGKYLSFLSSDDMIYPECVARLVPIMETNPQVSFAYCRISMLDEMGQIIDIPRNSHTAFIHDGHQELNRYVRYGDPRWIIGALIRLSAYQKIDALNEGWEVASDFLLAVQLASVGDVAYLDEVLASVRAWGYTGGKQYGTSGIGYAYRLYKRFEAPDILPLITGGQKTLQSARRRWAILWAMNLPQKKWDPTTTDKEKLIHELRLLDNSLLTQSIIWLVQSPFGPIISNLGDVEIRLRLLAVKLIYYLRSARKKLSPSVPSVKY